MRNLILLSFIFVGCGAFAAEESALSLHAPESAAVSSTNNFTEIGMQYSSINDGTPFATAALIHEWDNGFSMGARGGLPLQFHNAANSYLMQATGRFMLKNTLNQLYVEPTLSMVIFNSNGPAHYFGMIGMNYGYNRVIAKDVTVGAHIGADWANSRVTNDNYYSGTSTIYSNLGVSGSYYF